MRSFICTPVAEAEVKKEPGQRRAGGSGMDETQLPWLKRFEEPHEPDDDEQIDYEVMLEELEFR